MIDIAAGKSTPRILLDSDKKEFLIEGQSYPENSMSFYEPVIAWIKEYLSKENEEFLLKIRLLYINTSSTKAMFYIFDILEEAFKNGKNVKINWIYDSENEMAKETGEELLEDLTLPYTIVEQ
jgi:SiaC family regulatory phosphoprotein